jgi:hypothetical protein
VVAPEAALTTINAAHDWPWTQQAMLEIIIIDYDRKDMHENCQYKS